MGIEAAIIGSAVVGAASSRSAAKRSASATRAAADAQMEPFRLKAPYLEALYDKGMGTATNRINAGIYEGQRVAGIDPAQQQYYDAMMQYGAPGGVGTRLGQGLLGGGAKLFGAGLNFGQNAGSIYNRAAADRNAAIAADMASLYDSDVVKAAMRDTYRNLDENILTGNAMKAQAAGQRDGSRRFVMDAIAERGARDREDDFKAQYLDRLYGRVSRGYDQDINNMLNANRGVGNAFTFGQNAMQQGGQQLVNAALASRGAGDAARGINQAVLDADIARFNERVNLPMNTYLALGGLYGDAPSVGQVPYSTASPSGAALAGGIAGAGMGMNAYNQYQMYKNLQPPTPDAYGFTGGGGVVGSTAYGQPIYRDGSMGA